MADSAELRDLLWERPHPIVGPALERYLAAVAHKPGAGTRRERAREYLVRYRQLLGPRPAMPALHPEEARRRRYERWAREQAQALAREAGLPTDDPSPTYMRGEHFRVEYLDYASPRQAAAAPYCDDGGRGLALVAVTRTRVYARSSGWRPSLCTQHYLLGLNRDGSAWAHPVVPCATIARALGWLWWGYAADIVRRQGDVAIIGSPRRGRSPELPARHSWEPGPDGRMGISHPEHGWMPGPGPGERVVVARRAADRLRQAPQD